MSSKMAIKAPNLRQRAMCLCPHCHWAPLRLSCDMFTLGFYCCFLDQVTTELTAVAGHPSERTTPFTNLIHFLVSRVILPMLPAPRSGVRRESAGAWSCKAGTSALCV